MNKKVKKNKVLLHWAKALVQEGEIGRTRGHDPTAVNPYAIYPVGTTFNKEVLKEFHCKVVDVKIIQIEK